MTRATIVAFAGAVRDLRNAWTRWHSAGAAIVAVAALLPSFAPSWVHIDAVAVSLYLGVAATGLWLSVGLGGMPSLGQGAFMAMGAFACASLAGKADWSPFLATVGAVLVAAAGGALTGAGVVRLQPVFVAVSTWIVSWGLVLFLFAFPGVSGGAQGIVVPATLTPGQHFELALALLVLAMIGCAALARGRPGIDLLALAQRPAAALALGVDAPRRRIGAFVASAAIAGLAGALTVQLVGVADPGDYGPFLSFQLLAAVLLGGVASPLGPAIGVGVLALVNGAAVVVGHVERVPAERFDPMLAALVLLVVLAIGGESEEVGIVPALRRRFERVRPSAPVGVEAEMPPTRGAELTARKLSKRFAGVVAAEDVSLSLRPGEVCGLVGPNGSGKTTVLRLLAGTLRGERGSVVLDGRDISASNQRQRVELGIVRTLQSSAAFDDLSVVDNAVVGAGLHRRYGGALRTITATPRNRAEERLVRESAAAALLKVGVVGRRARELGGPEQRLLAVASAVAARPRVLLLDEPSAGSSPADVARLVAVLRRLREEGLTILLVEHNLRLVRLVADRVVVMAAGRVIAEGSPAEISADPRVREAYLGRSVL